MARQPDPLPGGKDGEDRASALPAFIVDTAAGAVVAANAAGRRAWGLAPGRGRVAVDRAMPVLRQLAPLGRSRARARLAFWTPSGLLVLLCRVEPRGAGAFLVRALADGGRAQGVGSSRCTAGRGPDLDAAQTAALARLAHEIRTPLSAAIAYAEVLKDEHFGPLPSPRYREYVRTIHDSARHALSVVDGMLAGAQGGGMGAAGELAFRDLDPAGVIDNCLAVARPLAERAGLTLVAHFGRSTPRVIADEVSLKQMLLNLITNAIKYARPGDRVTLGAVSAADGGLRIEVADTGPGMVPVMRALGRREGRAAGSGEAARSDGGLGIGLPLTRALAEANGARLIVDSAPGRGTRVAIAFGKDRVVPV
jgi:signal transduction histidine kinase